MLQGRGASEGVSAERRLADLLDSVLDDPALYDEGVARRLPPPRTHEDLVIARKQSGELEKPDLERFNRLLLEDAYPRALERIYRARLDAVIADISPPKGAVLVAGLLLSIVSVLYVTLNRPSRADALTSSPRLMNRRTQGDVLRYSLLPTVLAGVFLSLSWAWFRASDPDQPTSFLESFEIAGSISPPFGLLLLGLGIALYMVALLAAWALVKRRPRFGDVCAALVTGCVGGVLTWLALHTLFAHPAPVRNGLPLMPALYVASAVPVYLLIFFASATAFVAATSRRRAARALQWFALEDEDREWLGRHAAWLLVAAIGWLVFNALVLFGAHAAGRGSTAVVRNRWRRRRHCADRGPECQDSRRQRPHPEAGLERAPRRAQHVDCGHRIHRAADRRAVAAGGLALLVDHRDVVS